MLRSKPKVLARIDGGDTLMRDERLGYVLASGPRVQTSIAETLIAEAHVLPNNDGLWPEMSQTWRRSPAGQ